MIWVEKIQFQISWQVPQGHWRSTILGGCQKEGVWYFLLQGLKLSLTPPKTRHSQARCIFTYAHGCDVLVSWLSSSSSSWHEVVYLSWFLLNLIPKSWRTWDDWDDQSYVTETKLYLADMRCGKCTWGVLLRILAGATKPRDRWRWGRRELRAVLEREWVAV